MLPQGEQRGPYLFAAKALVPQLPSNPSQSRQSESIRLPHRQSDSVRVNSSLLHIITYYKDYIYFNSFTCTGRPDLIDPGRFKFAGRNLVGLQVQVDSEVNSNLSQVLVED